MSIVVDGGGGGWGKVARCRLIEAIGWKGCDTRGELSRSD